MRYYSYINISSLTSFFLFFYSAILPRIKDADLLTGEHMTAGHPGLPRSTPTWREEGGLSKMSMQLPVPRRQKSTKRLRHARCQWGLLRGT